MSGSIAAVLSSGEADPDAAAVARERYGFLTPWQMSPQHIATYNLAVLHSG
jgi:hypothetical protein